MSSATDTSKKLKDVATVGGEGFCRQLGIMGKRNNSSCACSRSGVNGINAIKAIAPGAPQRRAFLFAELMRMMRGSRRRIL
jgi:hypothetical protein